MDADYEQVHEIMTGRLVSYNGYFSLLCFAGSLVTALDTGWLMELAYVIYDGFVLLIFCMFLIEYHESDFNAFPRQCLSW